MLLEYLTKDIQISNRALRVRAYGFEQYFSQSVGDVGCLSSREFRSACTDGHCKRSVILDRYSRQNITLCDWVSAMFRMEPKV